MLKTLFFAIRMLWLGTGTSRSTQTRFILNLSLGIICGVAAFLSSYYLSRLIQSLPMGDTSLTHHFLFLLIAASATLVIARFVFRYCTEWLGRIIVNNIRRHYYTKLFHKNYAWHLENSVGYFNSMLDRITSLLRDWNTRLSYHFVASFVLIALFFAYTWSVSPALFLYFALCTAFLILVLHRTFTKRGRLYKDLAIKDRSFNKTFIDLMYNVRSVKKLSLLDFALARITKKGREQENASKVNIIFGSYQWLFMEFFVRAQFLVPLSYFVLVFIRTGQGLDVMVMLAAVQTQMTRIGDYIMHFMRELISSKQDFDLLAEHLSEDEDKPVEKSCPRNWKTILFRDTYFKFRKGRQTFEHRVPKFCIQRGDHIAVMGKSGEGKSTFLNLLTRQYCVTTGAIIICGHGCEEKCEEVSRTFFEQEFTYISQDVELFDMSFYDNIVLGAKISPKKLNKIIKGCCLEELVARMKGNLHTDIGEKGIKVSGGEKQRINLARGLLLDREVLVLDEITANLDPATTKKIWGFIFKEYGKKTIIAVSHEEELLKHVNKKILFKSGVGSACK